MRLFTSLLIWLWRKLPVEVRTSEDAKQFHLSELEFKDSRFTLLRIGYLQFLARDLKLKVNRSEPETAEEESRRIRSPLRKYAQELKKQRKHLKVA